MLSAQWKIGRWHREVYPEPDEVIVPLIVEKFKEEVPEFIENPSLEEAADVAIVLLAWADRNNLDLEAAIYDKLDILRSRDQRARDEERGITINENPRNR